MDSSMFYLCLGISLLFVTYFVYLFLLDHSQRQLKRRLHAREEKTGEASLS